MNLYKWIVKEQTLLSAKKNWKMWRVGSSTCWRNMAHEEILITVHLHPFKIYNAHMESVLKFHIKLGIAIFSEQSASINKICFLLIVINNWSIIDYVIQDWSATNLFHKVWVGKVEFLFILYPHTASEWNI